jgi:PEP-CTERM motif
LSGPNNCVALIFSSGVTITGPISSSGYYDYTVNVNPYPVTAGTHWLSILNDTGSWEWGAQLGGNAMQTNNWATPPPTWASNSLAMDFQLTGVPEPCTLAFLGTGLAGLVALSRRRKARA